jgi:predicted ATPase/DNA-binding CsgD family transcriptional regulator/tetratricopeptide (TPR) repeat protein
MRTSRLPQVSNDRLFLPNAIGEQPDVVIVGSDAWYNWLTSESTRSFAFKNHLGTFTVRRERKRNGWYWYVYRKQQGKLHKAYLGKAEEISRERLFTVVEMLSNQHESSNKRAESVLPDPEAQTSPLPAVSVDDKKPTILPQTSTLVYPDEAEKPHGQNNLPAQRSPLIGREQEIVRICSLLQRSEVRLLTLVGTGGIGKTRLGLQVATELSNNFADGVCFVPLASIRDPEMVVPTIAQILGIKETGGQSHLSLLKAYLRDKQLLLLLDNFEQVLVAAPGVSDLLTTCIHLKILLTSRAPLHISGEYEFHVPPLMVPDLKHLVPVEMLSGYAAVALFLQRARMIKPDFQISPANAPFIAEICVRLDGLPLAIELAAARSKLLPPQTLLARLERRLAVLTSGEQDAPVRQQTLRNTLDWSYELLNTDEQQLFRRLAIFVGGCYLSVFEKLCEALGNLTTSVLDGVASLLDKNLLQVTALDEEEPRLTMLETVREYALECLSASSEMEATQQAYVDTYCSFVKEADWTLLGIERETWPAWSNRAQETWLDWMEREHGNLRVVLDLLLERKEVEDALRFTVGIANLWFFRGSLTEGRRYFERVLALSRASQIMSKARAWALYVAGWQAFYRSDERHALVWLEKSRRIFQSLGYTRGVAANLVVLSDIEHHRGNTDVGDEMLEESLRLYRELPDYVGIGHALMTKGILVFFRGELAHACSLFEESLVASKKVGQRWVIASNLHYLGWAHFLQRDYAKAHQLSQESLNLFKEIGYGNFAVETQVVLADEIAALGDEVVAQTLLEEALMRGREMESPDDIARALYGLGSLAQRQGDLIRARSLYEEALAILKQKAEVPDRVQWVLASCLEGNAEIACAQGQFAWAVRLLAKADVLRTAGRYRNTIGYDQKLYRRIEAEAVTQMGEAVLSALWAEGRNMTTERVLEAQGLDRVLPAAHSTLSLTIPSLSVVPPSGLTRREFEVLCLLAEGLPNAQIAERLVISPTTVNSYLSSIYSKLGVSSRVGAMRYAIDHHLS